MVRKPLSATETYMPLGRRANNLDSMIIIAGIQRQVATPIAMDFPLDIKQIPYSPGIKKPSTRGLDMVRSVSIPLNYHQAMGNKGRTTLSDALLCYA